MDSVKLLYDIPTVKIKLIQYAKEIGWEVSSSGEDINVCLLEVLDTHAKLKDMFRKPTEWQV